jgi:hypothetical protein
MVEKPSESKTTATHAGTPPFAARKSLAGKPGIQGQPSSEVATLVYAVAVAVALGIACGAWINARLASAATASIVSPAPTRLLPVAGTNEQKQAETSAVNEPQLKAHNDTPSTSEQATPSHDFGAPPDAETPRANPSAPTDKQSTGKRGAVVPVPVAGEAGRPVRDAGRPEVEKRATAVQQGRAAPCALYVSANSLTLRNGGAATLLIGGPGEAGRITVSTPHWSDIAVFAEGRAGGNGWLRYSVRSVSKKPGVYVVRFTTPCGSQTVPVTVTRP